jgi:hypothetical protein
MHTLADFRSAAETLFPIRGSWSYDSWAAINERFFAGNLHPGPILWGLTAGCNFGSYNPSTNAITLHEALPGTDFAKAAEAQGERDWVMANRSKTFTSWGLPSTSFGIGTALGTLLHEAMHQSHRQQGLQYPEGRKGLEVHHNSIWVAECERVAKVIGLPDRIWPIYVERKETADEVRQRLGADANGLTGKQLNNRRQWVWVPTVDGEPIELIGTVSGPTTLAGQRVAEAAEITGFPRVSFNRTGITPPERVGLILP